MDEFAAALHAAGFRDRRLAVSFRLLGARTHEAAGRPGSSVGPCHKRLVGEVITVSTRSLTLDLHPIFNKGQEIDEALENAVQEAKQKKAKELEIICGKGTGQLKKRVLRFLDRKDIKQTYHRIDKDKDNSGRIFVYFRWKRGQ
jgi:DNA-nicking Smr family endonuclease